MKVLVLGGSGLIGGAVLRRLLAGGDRVLALARTETRAGEFERHGFTAIRGDLRQPGRWIDAVRDADAVVHAACTFDEEMGTVDRALLDHLIPVLQQYGGRLLYTGGCWLYGDTGGRIVDESAPLNPLPAFAWMAEGVRRVLGTDGLDGVVVHPAMVYTARGGCLTSFLNAAEAGRPVPVVGSPDTVWPFVHADDLGELYVRALESAPPRTAFNAAGTQSLAVGELASAVARAYGLPPTPVVRDVEAVASELGDWARGYALSQGLSSERARLELGWWPVWLDPRVAVSNRGQP